MKLKKDLITEVIMNEKEIKKRVKEIAKEIDKDYTKKNLVVVCALKGSVLFFSDLVKNIKTECELEFIKASSYEGTSSTGKVNIQGLVFDPKGKDILIVEDIVDTGLTMKALYEYFTDLGCNSVEGCALLNKQSRRVTEVHVKYIGKEIEDNFVIGYGLDYNELYRNLPCVGIINKKYI